MGVTQHDHFALAVGQRPERPQQLVAVGSGVLGVADALREIVADDLPAGASPAVCAQVGQNPSGISHFLPRSQSTPTDIDPLESLLGEFLGEVLIPAQQVGRPQQLRGALVDERHECCIIARAHRSSPPSSYPSHAALGQKVALYADRRASGGELALSRE